MARSDRFGYKPKSSDISEKILLERAELEKIAAEKGFEVDYAKQVLTKDKNTVPMTKINGKYLVTGW